MWKIQAIKDGRSYSPVGVHGNGFIIKSRVSALIPGDPPPDYRYLLWDPAADTFTELWATPGERQQDLIGDTDGPWVAFTRTGLSMPFPDWQLIVHNIETGEEQVIAEDDPLVLETGGLQPKLPLGFAPQPTISDGRVVWNAITFDDAGNPIDAVFLHDMVTGETEQLYSAPQGTGDGVYSASIGGDRVAWVEQPESSSPWTIEVLDLQTGAIEVIDGVGGPYSAQLSEDGHYLAYDDGMVAKWAVDLETGERTLYLDTAGGGAWGTWGSEHYTAWAVEPRGVPGVYDFETNTVRFVERPLDHYSLGHVFGDWFTWLIRPPDWNDDRSNLKPFYYYFVRLDE